MGAVRSQRLGWVITAGDLDDFLVYNVPPGKRAIVREVSWSNQGSATVSAVLYGKDPAEPGARLPLFGVIAAPQNTFQTTVRWSVLREDHDLTLDVAFGVVGTRDFRVWVSGTEVTSP